MPPTEALQKENQDVSSNEEEIEREPLLKYERVGGHFHAILKDDSISCIALYIQFMCVGTYNGHVLLLELDGRFLRRLYQHRKKVNQVCVDETGQFIASCSDDGTVALVTLASNTTNPNVNTTANTNVNTSTTTRYTENTNKEYKAAQDSTSRVSQSVRQSTASGEVNIYNYFSPIYSVQLEEHYASKRERSFACGGIAGQLLLNRKGWIIDKEMTVHEGEGPVHTIRWKGNLVAWANDVGVKVFDAGKERRVSYIERPANCPPMELCRCHLEWHGNDMLLIGWAHQLKVVRFKEKVVSKSLDDLSEEKMPIPNLVTTTEIPHSHVASSGLMLTAEIIKVITFDFFIAGLSPWDTFAICVMAFRPPGSIESTSSFSDKKFSKRLVKGEGDSGDIMPLPEVHVVTISGAQLAADKLPLRGYKRLRASDYHLPSLQYAHSNISSSLASHSILKASADDIMAQIYDIGFGRLQYLVAPKDIVLCRLRDVNDRVDFALQHGHYKRAVDLALCDINNLKVPDHSISKLVANYIDQLLTKNDYMLAAEELKRLLLGHEYADVWEKYVYIFAQKGQLNAVAKYIPTNNPRLPSEQYEMVLKHFLDVDPGQFLELIRKWPKPLANDVAFNNPAKVKKDKGMTKDEQDSSSMQFEDLSRTNSTVNELTQPLYDANAWIVRLEAIVRRKKLAEAESLTISTSESFNDSGPNDNKGTIAEIANPSHNMETAYIMEALAELYTATGQYGNALNIYLSQGAYCTNKDHAFKLISDNNLWSLVEHKVVNLFQIDRNRAIKLLANNVSTLKIKDVAEQLSIHASDREYLHDYLHELFVRKRPVYNTEAHSALHEKQVALYTEFAPSQLLPFLRNCNFVPLETAYKFCSVQNPPQSSAMVYILGRMGQHKKALDLILTQLKDINQAIEFVQETDNGLWEYLIDMSLSRPEFVEELLDCTAEHKIDPLKMIKKIPDDLEIHGLKVRLIEILRNVRMQVQLREGCTKVFASDRIALLEKQVDLFKRARRVEAFSRCSICQKSLKSPNSVVNAGKLNTERVCVFICGHCYHLPCLEEKMHMWTRGTMPAISDVDNDDAESSMMSISTSYVGDDIIANLRCVVCDNSARSSGRSANMIVENPEKDNSIDFLRGIDFSRDLTHEQLDRAREVLSQMQEPQSFPNFEE